MRNSRLICLVLLSLLAGTSFCLGQPAPLDQAATQALTARTAGDWAAIAKLAEQALQAELSPEEKGLAKQLVAKAYVGKTRAIVKGIQSRLGNQQFRQQTLPQLRVRALVDLEEAVRLAPQLWEGHVLIAKLHLFPGGERARAKEALDEAYQLTQKLPHAQATVLALRAGLQEDAEATLADYDRAIELAPQDCRFYRARGLWLARQGDREQAAADLEKALKIDPRNEQSQQMYVKILAESLPADQAFQNLTAAIKKFPQQAMLYFARARLLAAQEQWKYAKDDLDQALKLRPHWNAGLLMRVEVCGRLGDWETSLADVQEMLQRAPTNAKLVEAQINLLLRLNRQEQAIAELEEALIRGVAEAPLFHLLGSLYLQAGNPQRALSVFERALETDPKHVPSLQAVATLYLSSQQFPDAVQAYRTLVELKPKDSMALNNLAWLLATAPRDELRDGADALELALRACEQTNYEKPTLLHTLAAAYAEFGDFGPALFWLNQAETLDSEDKISEIEQHRRLLETRQPIRERAEMKEESN